MNLFHPKCFHTTLKPLDSARLIEISSFANASSHAYQAEYVSLLLTTPSLSSIFLVGITLLVVYSLYQCYMHPLAAYPGPFLAKITNFWRFYQYGTGQLHLVEDSLFKRYNSPVVRVGPSSLVFSSPAAYNAIHGFNKCIERGDFYIMVRFADKSESSVFSASSHAMHREKRKKLVSVAMTPRAFASYDPIASKARDIWLSELTKAVKASNDSSFDPTMLTKALSYDALSEMLVGRATGVLPMWKTKAFADAVKIKEKTGRDGFAFGYVPAISKFITTLSFTKVLFRRLKFDKAGNPIGRTLIFWKPLAAVENEIIPAAKRGSVSTPNVVKSLVDVPANDSRKMHSDAEIMAEITNMFFAGPGTTASAMTSLLHDLAIHPECQARISEEFANLPDDSIQSLGRASYFQAFVQESFRLRPADPIDFPRTIRRGAENALPDTLGPLPAGTQVGAVFYTVNRDKEVFGADSDEFRPDRWLTTDEAALKRMRSSWAVFGRGETACPGERFALSLMGKCFYSLLDRYRISAKEGSLIGRCNFEMAFEQCPLTFTPKAGRLD